MRSDFAQLIADTEREAHREGPEAVRELERFRDESRLAGREIAATFSEAQRAIADGDSTGLAVVASRASRLRAQGAVDRHGDL